MGMTITNGLTIAGGVRFFTPVGSINTTGNGGRIYTPASTNFYLGTSSWTMEGWFNATAKTRSNPILISNGNFGSNKWQINDRNGASTKFDFSSNDLGFTLSSTTTPVNGTWYYIAVVRSVTTFRFYVNGVNEASTVVSGSLDGATSSAQTVYLAGDQGQLAQTSWNGLMTSVKITIGTAIYPSGTTFTPPRTPNTSQSGTQLLLNPIGNAPFKDSSPNNWTMNQTIVSGQPSWSATNPLTSQS